MKTQDDKNIQKLRDHGMSDDDITDLVQRLQEDVAISMMMEIAQLCEESEFDEIEKKLAAANEDAELDGIEMVTDLYTKKTGKSPVIRATEIIDRYLELIVTSLEKLKGFGGKLKEVDNETLSKLNEAISSKEWDKIEPILKEIGIEEADLIE